MYGIGKHSKKGFTLIELLVVVMVIGILIVITTPKMSQSSLNSKIDTVETELRLISTNLIKYSVDFGGIYIKDYTTMAEDILLDEAKGLVAGINSYMESENELDITTVVVTNGNRIDINSKSKMDPWGELYKFYIGLEDGSMIMVSNGPNQESNKTEYYSGDFDDDIVIVLRTK